MSEQSGKNYHARGFAQEGILRAGGQSSEIEDIKLQERDNFRGHIIWPEEHLSELPYMSDVVKQDENRRFIFDVLQKYAAATVAGIFSPESRFGDPDADERVMRFLNGVGSERLARKFDFVNTVREIGYSAPRQLFIARATDEGTLHALMNSAGFVGNEAYWKPTSGRWGAGIRVLPIGDVPSRRLLDKDDYILQEKIAAKEDFRYWRINPQDQDVSWRHCYRSFRTDVIGDGKSTIFELLGRQQNVPAMAKALVAGRNIASLMQVPRDGETVELVKVAHNIRGAYFERPDERRIEYLDRFMAHFTKDLENNIGHALPILCFDIGIVDPRVFSVPFDLEKMKQSVVFFECQMPFNPVLDNNAKNVARVIALMIKSQYREP